MVRGIDAMKPIHAPNARNMATSQSHPMMFVRVTL